jgi:hypothetical protein
VVRNAIIEGTFLVVNSFFFACKLLSNVSIRCSTIYKHH